MLNIYETIRDEMGNIINGRTKLFILNVVEDDNIGNFNHGAYVVPEEAGTMFIVDSHVIEQIDKLKFINGQLVLKDGEEIVPPVKTDLEKQEEELEKQLAELRAKKETNNIE